MIVTTRPPKRAGWWSRRSRGMKLVLGGALGVVVLPILLVALFVAGNIGLNLGIAKMYAHGYMPEYGETARARTEFAVGLRTWAAAVLRPTYVPRLALDIKFRHLGRLRVQREEAIAAGNLVQGEDDYVPAVLHLPDRSVDVKLRLKGDAVDQFLAGRWSFRIHVKGDDQVFGMRRFSLHHPSVRDYQAEPLFLEHMRRVGVLAPRYMFVQVRLNGDDIGLMAIEEHFSTELLESQGRKESVILALDESLLWTYPPPRLSPFLHYATAKIRSFREVRVLGSPPLADDLRVATGLYRGFMDGTLEPSQVFDAKLTGRFFAIARAWSAWHATAWSNIRFYYNPITARLEPIAFDAELMRTVRFRTWPLARRILADSLIRQEFEKTLFGLKEELIQGGHLQALEDAQDRLMAELHREFPWARPLDLNHLTTVADRPLGEDTAAVPAFKKWARRKAPTITSLPLVALQDFLPAHLVRVSTITDGGERFLELSNLVPYDVEVGFVRPTAPGVGTDGPAPSSGAHTLSQVVLPAYGIQLVTAPTAVPAWETQQFADPVRILLPDSATIDSVYVRAVDSEEGAWVYPTPYYPRLASEPIPAPSLDAVSRHAFLDFDETRRTVTARPGTWDVDGSISLPEGVELILPAGTQLGFEPEAVLVVRGAVRFEGTQAEPVVLRGRETSDGFGPWQGMTVFNEGSETRWSHVRVLGTTGVDLENWHLTGAVTIYKGDVSISDTEFVGNRAEDALNLIHTSFTLDEVSVRDAISDGIDIDFGSGTVTGGEFSDIGWIGGGDAIDFSGATARITGTRFRQIGDKAISVGEGSTVRVSGVSVIRAGAGAVTKDGSYLSVEDTNMSEISNAALMAYIKKPEYGGAVLEASSVSVSDMSRLAHAQIGSLIRIDGERVPGEDINVDSLYATVMRRGAR